MELVDCAEKWAAAKSLPRKSPSLLPNAPNTFNFPDSQSLKFYQILRQATLYCRAAFPYLVLD